MTALTEDLSRTHVNSPRCKFFPVRALNQSGNPIKINKGDLIMRRRGVNLAEVPEDANPRTDLIPCGIARCAVDMTGFADGAKSVAVLSGGWDSFDTGSGGDRVTDADIGKKVFAKNNNTVFRTDGGGTLSPAGIVMFGDDDVDSLGITIWIDDELADVVADVAALQTTTSNQQRGTGTLVAGEATISATITATSRIVVSMKDPGAGAITGFASFDIPAADRNVGAGTFKVRAIDDAKALIATAVSTFDWHIQG